MKKVRDKENTVKHLYSVPKKRLKDKVIKTINKGYVHPSTEKNIKWLLKCFNEWWYARNENRKAIDKCPDDLLEVQYPEALNKWIATFIAEVCHVDGERYPPKSIHQLLSGIL